ncbi:DUF2079 domain-containing protein [Motilibacter deserti]|uniref:DUF2079 domain-containing protein n=1 Tax=Motilibacter deserti TaxID=2714956 RepID=A0ABX0GTW0_9ACTN|nr:DUF2079 domain-containing protein [Motilibacter deserti]
MTERPPLLERPPQQERAARAPGRRLRGPHAVAVPAVALALAAVHATLGLLAYRNFRVGSWDLLLFDETVRGYAGWGAPVQPALGVHLDVGPDLIALGDHFSPILVLLAPLYWVWDDPRMLILAQAGLIAVSICVAWVIARRVLGPGIAYAVAVATGLAWPLQEASVVGFHEVVFAVPLILLACERLQARRPGQAAAWAASLMLVKEDMGFVTVMFGVLLALRGWRKLGVWLAVAGLAGAYLSTSVIVPAFYGHGSPDGDYYEAFFAALPNPVDTFEVVFSPVQKEQTVLWLLAPFAFLPLASPVVLLTLPQLGERAISSNPNHWGLEQHYNAVLLPVLVVAAVEAARRLPRRWRQAFAAYAVLAAVVLCAKFPFADLADRETWRLDAHEQAAAQAVALVPAGVTVEADNEIGPHLADRGTVLLLDKTPRDAPWVVVDVARSSFPIDSLAVQRDRVRLLQASGYELVLDNGSYAVLRRP